MAHGLALVQQGDGFILVPGPAGADAVHGLVILFLSRAVLGQHGVQQLDGLGQAAGSALLQQRLDIAALVGVAAVSQAVLGLLQSVLGLLHTVKLGGGFGMAAGGGLLQNALAGVALDDGQRGVARLQGGLLLGAVAHGVLVDVVGLGLLGVQRGQQPGGLGVVLSQAQLHFDEGTRIAGRLVFQQVSGLLQQRVCVGLRRGTCRRERAVPLGDQPVHGLFVPGAGGILVVALGFVQILRHAVAGLVHAGQRQHSVNAAQLDGLGVDGDTVVAGVVCLGIVGNDDQIFAGLLLADAVLLVSADCVLQGKVIVSIGAMAVQIAVAKGNITAVPHSFCLLVQFKGSVIVLRNTVSLLVQRGQICGSEFVSLIGCFLKQLGSLRKILRDAVTGTVENTKISHGVRVSKLGSPLVHLNGLCIIFCNTTTALIEIAEVKQCVCVIFLCALFKIFGSFCSVLRYTKSIVIQISKQSGRFRTGLFVCTFQPIPGFFVITDSLIPLVKLSQHNHCRGIAFIRSCLSPDFALLHIDHCAKAYPIAVGKVGHRGNIPAGCSFKIVFKSSFGVFLSAFSTAIAVTKPSLRHRIILFCTIFGPEEEPFANPKLVGNKTGFFAIHGQTPGNGRLRVCAVRFSQNFTEVKCFFLSGECDHDIPVFLLRPRPLGGFRFQLAKAARRAEQVHKAENILILRQGADAGQHVNELQAAAVFGQHLVALGT